MLYMHIGLLYTSGEEKEKEKKNNDSSSTYFLYTYIPLYITIFIYLIICETFAYWSTTILCDKNLKYLFEMDSWESIIDLFYMWGINLFFKIYDIISLDILK